MKTILQTNEQLKEKLREVCNILSDQNKDDSYDEAIGHVLTEAYEVLNEAEEKAPAKKTSKKK